MCTVSAGVSRAAAGGEDPSVKWSSGPRWVSNSRNPTGHKEEKEKKTQLLSHRRSFCLPPLALPLSTPLCLSNLTPPLPPHPSSLPPCLPVSPEKQREANEAWLAFIQLSIPLCVSNVRGTAWRACVCVWYNRGQIHYGISPPHQNKYRT